MYRFYGMSTNYKQTYDAEGLSLFDIYCQLVEQDVISEQDNSPYDDFLIKKAGITVDYFINNYGEFDPVAFQNWKCDNEHKLQPTELEYIQLINECDGKAYYQNFLKLIDNNWYGWSKDSKCWELEDEYNEIISSIPVGGNDNVSI